MLKASVLSVCSCWPAGALRIASQPVSNAASAYRESPCVRAIGGGEVRGREGGSGHNHSGASSGSTVVRHQRL